jgi:hypothetical protein
MLSGRTFNNYEDVIPAFAGMTSFLFGDLAQGKDVHLPFEVRALIFHAIENLSRYAIRERQPG